MPLNKHEALAALPPEWPHDVLPEIQRRLAESKQKVVVLDDDPTGTQSVHGIPVLTEWSVESLRAELHGDKPAFYVLTNTRAMTLDKAQAVMAEIGRNLVVAASSPLPLGEWQGVAISVIGRSDSTLRGHFPGEVEALADVIRNMRYARPPYLLTPAFFAGGRTTLNDVHYVAYGDELVPAGETEFAKDAAFGYRASNLREWVQEKTGDAINAADVVSISIDDIRRGGPERVADVLAAVPAGGACIANAAAERDLEVVALACLMAEARGQRFLYRSAASFARARSGIAQRALLTGGDVERLVETRHGASLQHGGLIVVGSYVPKTTGQLQALLDRGVDAIEVNVAALLGDAQRDGEIARCAAQADALIGADRDTVIYTSRTLITGDDAAGSLAIGNRVSDALIDIVRGITAQPRYVLAKGGITSSDVATKALNVKRAMVLGQLLPGVPVWQLGPESRYPGAIYVVFPGNVGGPEALAEAHRLLSSD
jgi:uncharacterized protein YgbK (DUF1537 family)